MDPISVSGKLNRLVRKAVKDERLTVDEKKEILKEIDKDGTVDNQEQALLNALDERKDFHIINKNLTRVATGQLIQPLNLDIETPTMEDVRSHAAFKLEPAQSGEAIEQLHEMIQTLDFAFMGSGDTYTPDTTKWIEAFQSSNDLNVTGEVDRDTLIQLEKASRRLPELSDLVLYDRAELKIGDTGQSIRDLNLLLNQIDYHFQTPETDVFSEDTQRFIAQIQEDHNLPPSGLVDGATHKVLMEMPVKTPTTIEVYNGSIGSEFTNVNSEMAPAFRMGQSGEEIAKLHILMEKVIDGFEATSDSFDPLTDSAVRQFQSDNGIPSTGVVNEETLGLMESATKLDYDQIYHPDSIPIDGFDFASEQERVKAIVTNQIITTHCDDPNIVETAFQIGEDLLVEAKKVDRRMASSSKCYTAVKRTIENSMGLDYKAYRGKVDGSYGSYARTADATYFQDYSDYFVEITGLTREDTQFLPAGAIMVYKPNKKSAAGHIGIQNGQGKDVSDKTRNQKNVHSTTTDFRIYFPVALPPQSE